MSAEVKAQLFRAWKHIPEDLRVVELLHPPQSQLDAWGRIYDKMGTLGLAPTVILSRVSTHTGERPTYTAVGDWNYCGVYRSDMRRIHDAHFQRRFARVAEPQRIHETTPVLHPRAFHPHPNRTWEMAVVATTALDTRDTGTPRALLHAINPAFTAAATAPQAAELLVATSNQLYAAAAIAPETVPEGPACWDTRDYLSVRPGLIQSGRTFPIEVAYHPPKAETVGLRQCVDTYGPGYESTYIIPAQPATFEVVASQQERTGLVRLAVGQAVLDHLSA